MEIQHNEVRIMVGDALAKLRQIPSDSIHCVVTSPPYWGQRDYCVDGQLGLEATPDQYVANMVTVFREVRRVLRPDGNCFLNIGDSYVMTTRGKGGDGKQSTNKGSHLENRSAIIPDGLKPKDKALIPFRLALALQSDGWWVRQTNIWHKPNAMPESVKDRTTTAHEYVFHLTKSARYWYDADAIREPHSTTAWGNGINGSIGPADHGWLGQNASVTSRWWQAGRAGNHPKGKNKRSVWEISTVPYPGAHFAVFPPELAEIPIKCGCPEGGIVLDPFGGSGTTGYVARRLNRRALLIELNSEYVKLAQDRIYNDAPLLNLVTVEGN